jgi:hypothetical protein
MPGTGSLAMKLAGGGFGASGTSGTGARRRTPTPTPTPTTTTPTTTTTKPAGPPQIVPGQTATTGQINIADYAGQVAMNPSLAFRHDDPATPNVNESMLMEDRLKGIDENAAGTNLNPADPRYAQQAASNLQAAQAGTAQSGQVTPKAAADYQAQQTQQAVEDAAMEAAQGTVNPDAIIDPNVADIDMQGMATGTNADGSINYTGEALKEYANLDLNDVDAKATVKGQMDLLQADFTGPNGEPRIPPYAAGLARNVGKIAAFKGMTGTAATAAMAQALMEASLPIAQQDAQFFQTVTLQNLTNKQQSTINRANVLAKMDQVNADNRMAAAIQNSKNFMDMDLKNLDNAQQAAVINTQARVQSILEDAKAVNTQRLFSAESQNEMNKFYDQLSSEISMFNTNQANQMAQFNTGEVNSMGKFNADLNNQREQFYKTMQYNIDTANAKWRQTVTLTESEQAFEAAATDVKNMVGISVEQMNQLWDRSDALLDYIWKSTESELDRKAAMSLQNKKLKSEEQQGFGQILGSIAGAVAGSDQFLGWLF